MIPIIWAGKKVDGDAMELRAIMDSRFMVSDPNAQGDRMLSIRLDRNDSTVLRDILELCMQRHLNS